MKPRIELITEKKLAGKHMSMTFAGNRTAELWRGFMQQRSAIKNNLTTDVISMQVYGPLYDFNNFDPHAGFEKWAAVEVADFAGIPEGMEAFTLPGGLYAVFIHKGSSTDNTTFQYIFGTWLPGSEYVIDSRPHFEILGEKYKNGDSSSEEEIWIPVKLK
jgi:AraC family transcriptional regulator